MQRAGTTSIEWHHRVALTEVATASSDWISHTGWEASRDYFLDYPLVAAKILEHIQEIEFAVPADYDTKLKVELIFVCGADLALRHR